MISLMDKQKIIIDGFLGGKSQWGIHRGTGNEGLDLYSLAMDIYDGDLNPAVEHFILDLIGLSIFDVIKK